MRTQLITTILFGLSVYISAQGLINNGANITINNGTYLVINGESGNFTVESGEVYLYGKIILSGNLNNKTTNVDMFNGIDNNHTDLTFSGTEDQLIGGLSTENIVCQNLTVNFGSKAILSAGKKLTVLGNLVNNGTLTVGASEDQQSTVKVNGTVSGAGVYNVEAYLSAGRNWYVSSPVSDAKSGMFNASSNTVYWYDEAHGSTVPWATITDNVTSLEPMRGYVATVPISGNVTFTGGAFNNSTENLTVYRTAGQTKEGFNLIGNPFPAYYDYGSSSKINIQPSYWYRAKNAGNTAYVFDTYSVTNGLGTSLSGRSVTCNIPPMQAFWVRVNNGQSSGVVSFDKQYVNHCDLSANRRRSPEATKAKYIRLQITNGVNYDETILVFNSQASNSYDAYDSPKMSNANAFIPELFTLAGEERVAINGMPLLNGNQIIPLGFSNFKTGTNSFKLTCSELSNLGSDTHFYLHDLVLGTQIELQQGVDYEFNSDVYNDTKRFVIVTNSTVTNTGALSASRDGLFVTVKSGGIIHISCLKASTLIRNCIFTDIQGKQLIHVMPNSTAVDIPTHLPPGVYMVASDTNEGRFVNKLIIE